MSNPDLRSYYKWHAPIYDATRWTFLHGRNKLVQNIVSNPDYSRVLEIGCGTGWLLKRCLHKQTDTVFTGIDLSTEMISKTKINLQNYANVTLINESILDFDDHQKFDTIYASYSISMMKSIYTPLFKKIASLLKKDALFYIVDFYSTSFPFFEKWMKINHVDFLSNNLSELSRHFEIVKIEKTKVYFGLWEYAIIVVKSNE